MALQPPRTGELRQRVRFERRAESGDGFGNHDDVWNELGAPAPDRAGRLTPTRGGEEVIAGRLTGVSSFDLWVRYDALTATMTPADRVVDVRSERTFAILWAEDIDGRRRWILMQLQSGGADG